MRKLKSLKRNHYNEIKPNEKKYLNTFANVYHVRIKVKDI